MKVDLATGDVLAEVALEGAQELALLDGKVYVTRGGLDPVTWGPLDLESHLVWLSADDLSLEGELPLASGPQYACQAICIHNGLVVVGVNNGWVWGGEVGLVGTFDPASGMYTEVDLGDTGKNPVALHEVNGAVLSVNNGDWSSTSVSRVVAGETLEASTEVLADVAAGCNASAVVSANRLGTPNRPGGWPAPCRRRHRPGHRRNPEPRRDQRLQLGHSPHQRHDLQRRD